MQCLAHKIKSPFKLRRSVKRLHVNPTRNIESTIRRFQIAEPTPEYQRPMPKTRQETPWAGGPADFYRQWSNAESQKFRGPNLGQKAKRPLLVGVYLRGKPRIYWLRE